MAKTKVKISEEITDGKKVGYQEQGAQQNNASTSPATVERDDSWKDDLRSAYDTSAQRQIEASDESFQQAIANADHNALSRGMQRSSYNNATLAKLEADKVRAQNNIRENTEAAFNQAVVNRENQIWQQNFQESQAAQQQQNWQASFDNTVQQQQQSQANWQAQFDNTVQQQQQSQANWQAQFDANQQQQAWQNQFQQNQWNWQVSQAEAAAAQAAAAASSGRPSSSNNPGNNSDKPWEALNLTEEEYEKLKNSLNNNNNVNLFGNNAGGALANIQGYANNIASIIQ